MTGDGSKMVDATTMLSICDPVHIVLIKTDTLGETTLVASYFLEWRSVLSAENKITNVAVELLGVGKFKISFNIGKNDVGCNFEKKDGINSDENVFHRRKFSKVLFLNFSNNIYRYRRKQNGFLGYNFRKSSFSVDLPFVL